MNRRGFGWGHGSLLWLAFWPLDAGAERADKYACLAEDSSPACEQLVAERSRFPEGAFDDTALSSFVLLWYSEHLAAMAEPVLTRIDERPAEAYRFLWLRTFHHPVVLRLQDVGGEKTLVVKQTNGAGGYRPGELVVDRTIRVGAEEWNTFQSLLDAAGYWRAAETDRDEMGGDGAQWVLEAVRDGRYHIVERWSPDERYSSEENLNFRDACLYLLKLSGLAIEPLY